ncbi:MAG: shikimate kinase [Ignavibacteria bacterium]|nr:shikimate kinase [Ignavibacteria bacterium]
MNRNARVYLTGFMGSGKSTIGPILANSIGWSFVDVDSAVEESAGRSVQEIFEGEGEAAFRMLERKVIDATEQMTRTVIALGGGTIASEQNFRQVARAGILVYLQVDRDDLTKRLRNKANRPLLATSVRDVSVHETLDALFKVREPFYAMADIVVATGKEPVGRTVDELVRKLTPLIL